LGILCFYIIFNLPFLSTFPPINNVGDESWMTNLSLELLRTGKPLLSMAPQTPFAEEVQVSTFWIFISVLSGIFSIFGPSIWIGRFLSFICGIIVIILTYRFGKDAGGERVGLTASFLLATSLPFSWHSREIRPEMMLLIFSTISFHFFYLAWRGKGRKFLLLSGLLSTISVLVHPVGALVACSILIVYAFYFGKRIITAETMFLMAGMGIGFTIWFIVAYLPHSLTAFQTAEKHYLPPILHENLSAFLKTSIINLFSIYSFSHLHWLASKYHSYFLPVIVYVASVLLFIALLFGENKNKARFLISLVISLLCIRFLAMGSWSWLHYPVIYSICSVALSLAIFSISDGIRWEYLKKILPIMLIIVFGITGTFDILRNNINMMKYSYESLMSRISASVPIKSTVLGSALFYPAFLEKDNRFITYTFLKNKCPDFAQEIQDLKIDYILLDDNLIFLSSSWCTPQYYETQIVGFINRRTSYEGTIMMNYPNEYDRSGKVFIFKVQNNNEDNKFENTVREK
jgi:4-amino-4-deoxy-L-arabinose transferase-like glycosyltransferase